MNVSVPNRIVKLAPSEIIVVASCGVIDAFQSSCNKRGSSITYRRFNIWCRSTQQLEVVKVIQWISLEEALCLRDSRLLWLTYCLRMRIVNAFIGTSAMKEVFLLFNASVRCPRHDRKRCLEEVSSLQTMQCSSPAKPFPSRVTRFPPVPAHPRLNALAVSVGGRRLGGVAVGVGGGGDRQRASQRLERSALFECR